MPKNSRTKVFIQEFLKFKYWLSIDNKKIFTKKRLFKNFSLWVLPHKKKEPNIIIALF